MKDASVPAQLMTTLDRLDMDAIRTRLLIIKKRITRSTILHTAVNASSVTRFVDPKDDTKIDFRRGPADVAISVDPSDGLRWFKMKEIAHTSVLTLEECLAVLERWISHVSLPLHRMDHNSAAQYPQSEAAIKAGRIFQACAPTAGAQITLGCPNPYRWNGERIAMGPGQKVYIADELAEEIFGKIPSTIQLNERASLGYEFVRPENITVDAPEIIDPLERMQILASVGHVSLPVVTQSGNKPKKSIV